MRRPDEKRFKSFTQHLTVLDPKLREFAQTAGFEVEINPFHQPGRYLRRPGNPHSLIVFTLDRNWRISKPEPDMAHTVSAISYYFPPSDPSAVWQKTDTLLSGTPFSHIVSRLENILEDALGQINRASPESIVRLGTRQDNLQFKYRDYIR